MKRMLTRILQLSAITSVIVLSASCAAAQPTVKPADKKPAESSKIQVIDIVGIHEWEPLQEGSLICAVDGFSDTPLKYSWSAEQGVISGEGKEVKWTAPGTTGSYRVTVQVSNAGGEGSVFSKSFEVTDNPYNNETPDTTVYLKLSLPSSTVTEAAARLRSYTTMEIECQVDGIDAGELTYKWTAPTGRLLGNGLEEGRASKVGWIAPGVGGDYKVTVVVTDKSGNSAGGQVNFNVYCCKP